MAMMTSSAIDSRFARNMGLGAMAALLSSLMTDRQIRQAITNPEMPSPMRLFSACSKITSKDDGSPVSKFRAGFFAIHSVVFLYGSRDPLEPLPQPLNPARKNRAECPVGHLEVT